MIAPSSSSLSSPDLSESSRPLTPLTAAASQALAGSVRTHALPATATTPAPQPQHGEDPQQHSPHHDPTSLNRRPYVSKNPYALKMQEFPDTIFTNAQSERYRGRWSERFLALQPHHHQPSSQRPDQGPGEAPSHLPHDLTAPPPPSAASSPKLTVEIGCNAGHVICEWAKRAPEQNFIGIDWKYKAIYRAATKTQANASHNVVLLQAKAQRLAWIFGPQEVDAFNLFFPDPWPKKAHWKHRLVTPIWLQELASCLKPGGVLSIKTDHPGYFQWILNAAREVEGVFRIIDLQWDLHQQHPNPESLRCPEVTLFEQLFIRQKLPIHQLHLQLQL